MRKSFLWGTAPPASVRNIMYYITNQLRASRHSPFGGPRRAFVRKYPERGKKVNPLPRREPNRIYDQCSPICLKKQTSYSTFTQTMGLQRVTLPRRMLTNVPLEPTYKVEGVKWQITGARARIIATIGAFALFVLGAGYLIMPASPVAQTGVRATEVCLDCHDDAGETLSGTMHQILPDDMDTPEATLACTDCPPRR